MGDSNDGAIGFEIDRHHRVATITLDRPAKLNALTQFTAPLAGIDVHFIHEEGKGPDPMPLLVSHGWPGSVVEFRKLIPMLCEPARFGADPRDAFTVVAPSLPGYTLSFKPGQKRFGVEEIAEVFAALMTDVLGYRRFGAQGGDWGAFVSSVLGLRHAEKLRGIHLNLLAVRRDPHDGGSQHHPVQRPRGGLGPPRSRQRVAGRRLARIRPVGVADRPGAARHRQHPPAHATVDARP